MNIILLKDIPNLGKAGDVKKVSSGYARNQLIPHKLATLATPEAVQVWERKQARTQQRAQQSADKLAAQAKRLGELTLSVTEKATEKGKLFAGIDKKRIISLLSSDYGVMVSNDMLLLGHPIKEIGTHDIPFVIGETEGVFVLDIKSNK